MNYSKLKQSGMLWKGMLFLTFFFITPVALFSSIFALISLSSNQQNTSDSQLDIFSNPKHGAKVYASIPSDTPSVSGEVVEADARNDIVAKYLTENQSPLTPYAQYIVQTADKYKLDYRLITAIAQKESGLCRVIPEGSHNCWGWGIHSKGTLFFDSYEEGIETVSKGLREFYLDEGYVTVPEIMKKYAHPSSTTWADGVLLYMSQIEDILKG